MTPEQFSIKYVDEYNKFLDTYGLEFTDGTVQLFFDMYGEDLSQVEFTEEEMREIEGDKRYNLWKDHKDDIA